MLLAMSLVLEGGLLALALLLSLLFEVAPWETLRFDVPAFLLGGVATLPLLLFLWFSTRTSWTPLRRLRRLVENIVQVLFAPANRFDLALIAMLAGVCEETFFRGFLQALLAREWNSIVAFGVTAILFALAHPVSRLYAFVAGGISLYLSALYAVSHNLIPPMLTHGLYDFLALLYWRRQLRVPAREANVAPKGQRPGPKPAGSPQPPDHGEH